jgi:hypothetical protein
MKSAVVSDWRLHVEALEQNADRKTGNRIAKLLTE